MSSRRAQKRLAQRQVLRCAKSFVPVTVRPTPEQIAIAILLTLLVEQFVEQRETIHAS